MKWIGRSEEYPASIHGIVFLSLCGAACFALAIGWLGVGEPWPVAGGICAAVFGIWFAYGVYFNVRLLRKQRRAAQRIPDPET